MYREMRERLSQVNLESNYSNLQKKQYAYFNFQNVPLFSFSKSPNILYKVKMQLKLTEPLRKTSHTKAQGATKGLRNLLAILVHQ